MTRLVILLAGSCLALFGCGDSARRPTAPRQGSVTARASLERTAVWVGEPVTYTIEVTCPPGFDINEDDLGRDHLLLTGLEIRDAHVARASRADGTVAYRASFQLVSFEADSETLRIGARSLRYYQRRDDGGIAERPSGAVEVPQEELLIRSVLPDSLPATVRAVKPPILLPSFARLIQPLGVTLVVLSFLIVGSALAAPHYARRSKRVATAAPAPRPVTDYRRALDDIQRLDAAPSPEALHQAFERLDRLLRERLEEAGIAARSLTPDEIGPRLDTAGHTMTADAVVQVLRECERVRYGGSRHAPSRDLLAQTVVHAQRALSPTEGLPR